MKAEKWSDAFVKTQDLTWEQTDDKVLRKLLCYNKDLMMTHVRFEKGGIGKKHHHPHRQISFIAEGVFEVEIDGKKETLHKGDSFIVESDLIHGVVALEAGEIVDIFTPYREDFL